MRLTAANHRRATTVASICLIPGIFCTSENNSARLYVVIKERTSSRCKEHNAQNNACAKAILACFEALYRTAFRLTGNKAQAEDLVQETYLRAWRSLSRLHGLSSVQPWMFRILRTVFIDQLRRESKRPKLVTDVENMLAASERLSPRRYPM